MNPTLDTTARRLRDAYAGPAIDPLRDTLAADDGDAAYAIQAINTRYWVSAGRRVVGRKVGLTAKAVQAQLGVDQPDFGVLFADMEIADGGVLRADQVLQPKAEAEIAFVLAHDLDQPDSGIEGVASAIAYAVPAIEIVDSRIADWKISFADTVADNGSSAFFVLGTEHVPLAGLDLEGCEMTLTVDGAIAATGSGRACLGDPLNAVAWLARTLAARLDPLRAGDIVLSGALGPMVAIAPGADVRATIAGLGTVGFNFEAAR